MYKMRTLRLHLFGFSTSLPMVRIQMVKDGGDSMKTYDVNLMVYDRRYTIEGMIEEHYRRHWNNDPEVSLNVLMESLSGHVYDELEELERLRTEIEEKCAEFFRCRLITIPPSRELTFFRSISQVKDPGYPDLWAEIREAYRNHFIDLHGKPPEYTSLSEWFQLRELEEV